MSDNVVYNRNLRFLNWILVGLACGSCLCRPDWNLVVGFISLAVLMRSNQNDEKYFSGLLFFFYAFSLVIDVLWMAVLFPSWKSGDGANAHWDSLSFMHNLVSLSALVEFLVKGLIVFLLFKKGAHEGFKFINENGPNSISK